MLDNGSIKCKNSYYFIGKVYEILSF